MTDPYAEGDEWPTPDKWTLHQAETGLTPPVAPMSRPNDDREVWRGRGKRIAALEAENAGLRVKVARIEDLARMGTAAVRREEALREDIEALAAPGSTPDGESLPEWVHVDDLRALLAASPAATVEAWKRIVEFAQKHSASMHEAARLGREGRDPSFEDDYFALIEYFRPAPVPAPSDTEGHPVMHPVDEEFGHIELGAP